MAERHPNVNQRAERAANQRNLGSPNWISGLRADLTGANAHRTWITVITAAVTSYFAIFAVFESRHDRQMNLALYERNAFLTMVSAGNDDEFVAAMQNFGGIQSIEVQANPSILMPWKWLDTIAPNRELLQRWAQYRLGRYDRSKYGESGYAHRIGLMYANFSNATLSTPPPSRIDLSNIDFLGADFSDADLRWSLLDGSRLSGANFSGANLVSSILRDSILAGADLSQANLEGALLHGSSLLQANLSGANLSEADLSETDLNGANLSGTNLVGAILTGAKLGRSTKLNCSFPDCNIDELPFWNCSTKWPSERFAGPPCAVNLPDKKCTKDGAKAQLPC